VEEPAISIADVPATGIQAEPLTAEMLCRVYAKRVFKFAQLISSNSGDAEDLAQNALERAIRGAQNLHWVYRLRLRWLVSDSPAGLSPLLSSVVAWPCQLSSPQSSTIKPILVISNGRVAL
jgi:flavin-binding protein dodecin